MSSLYYKNEYLGTQYVVNTKTHTRAHTPVRFGPEVGGCGANYLFASSVCGRVWIHENKLYLTKYLKKRGGSAEHHSQAKLLGSSTLLTRK